MLRDAACSTWWEVSDAWKYASHESERIDLNDYWIETRSDRESFLRTATLSQSRSAAYS